MIPIGEIKLNTDLFVNKDEIEKTFPFHFRDMLYGNRSCPETEERHEIQASPYFPECLFSCLIGQIIQLPNGERVRIEEVYINYWQQIGAHGEVVESE